MKHWTELDWVQIAPIAGMYAWTCFVLYCQVSPWPPSSRGGDTTRAKIERIVVVLLVAFCFSLMGAALYEILSTNAPMP